jgi:hypothetical protein
MATTQTANKPSGAKSAQAKTVQAEKSQAQKAAETVLDVPVGAALRVADRVTELVEPWTDRETAERQFRSYRTQLTRSVKRAERRGASARRKATTTARRTRSRLERQVRRVEREVRRSRHRAETTLRRNRRQVETQLRKVESRARTVQSDLEKVVESRASRAQELADQVGQQIASLV